MLNLKLFTFNPFSENTYVIYDERQRAAILDPGCYDEAEKVQLGDWIKASGLIPERLLLTHAHIDHVLGNQWVADTYGLKPWMHKLEKSNLDRLPTYAPVFGFPPLASPEAENWLDEGDVFYLGAEKLEILFTPGHSAGSICFYYPAGGWIISGDVLFRGSIGRTDLPGGDYGTLIHSVKEKLFNLPDETVVYPGHGPATTIGYEKKTNPFFQP